MAPQSTAQRLLADYRTTYLKPQPHEKISGSAPVCLRYMKDDKRDLHTSVMYSISSDQSQFMSIRYLPGCHKYFSVSFHLYNESFYSIQGLLLTAIVGLKVAAAPLRQTNI